MMAMVFGTYSAAALTNPDEMAERSFAKTRQLGIRVLSRTSVLGRYDFVTLLEVPSLQDADEFGRYFRSEGFGSAEVLPVTNHRPGEPD